MKVLVVGGGGREHALCWKLRQSPLLTELWCAPGNPGIREIARCEPIAVDKIEALVRFAESARIDLTVVGPEVPLSLGIVDAFEARGLRIFGPSAAAARLEGSKGFAKEIMIAAGVPTARAERFAAREALDTALRTRTGPYVIKADGLAAGKGVVVAAELSDALEGSRYVFEELKASTVLLEDFLDGVEASLIVATDGARITVLPTSHDYKRVGDRDSGPNTGGMGSVSPTPRVSEHSIEHLVDTCVRPVIDELGRRGVPFRGFLYAGLMIARDGTPWVLEYNCRLGDPECQSLMRQCSGDFLAELLALTERGVQERTIRRLPEHEGVSMCIVLASAGYPAAPETGDAISGVDFASNLPEAVVFHAGTALENGKLVTSGGRVLGVTARGADLATARANAYKAADMIQFRGGHRRRDIGS